MSRTVIFWIGLLLVFSGLSIVWFGSKYMPGSGAVTVVDDSAQTEVKLDKTPPLTEFELVDQQGNTINSNQFKGEVWAGSFFFANCPSTCYNQNIKLQQLNAKYADRGLKLVSITCDPTNDTPVALARYANRFKADAENWHFLTSKEDDVEYLQRIGNDFFNIMVAEETHTDHVVLFDRKGEMRGAFNVLKGEDQLALDKLVNELLDEPIPVDESDVNSSDSHEAVDSEQPAT